MKYGVLELEAIAFLEHYLPARQKLLMGFPKTKKNPSFAMSNLCATG